MSEFSDLLKNAQNAYKTNDFENAEKSLQKAYSIDPAHVTVNYILGLMSYINGKRKKAATYFEKAISVCNDDSEIYYNYGMTLQSLEQFPKAAIQYEKAILLSPNYIAALNNYSAAMQIMGHLEKAEKTALKIIELEPENMAPYVNLGNILKDQGRIDEALIYYNKAIEIQPHNMIANSNIMLCLNYSNLDSQSIFNEHKKWEERVKPGLSIKLTNYKNIEFEKKPIRIGYISGDFKTHSVAYFIEPILKNHDRSQFKIYCYSDVANPDPVTERMRQLSDKWCSIYKEPTDRVVSSIMDDGIDILVDLAGHAGSRRLPVFLNRPAPCQVTYLGYPNTTGLSTMDYRLTDDWSDPEGIDKYYTEKLIRIKDGFLCYKPPVAPAVQESPCIKNGYITFGSFNNLSKISQEVITLWTNVLKSIPDSKLMIKSKSFNDEKTLNYYIKQFTDRSIKRERLLFLGRSPSIEEHLNCYNNIDIALDTMPYNGTTTTCEAMWMGVPVITLDGTCHSGKVGVSLLRRIGLAGMIADSPEKFIAIAIFLSKDKKLLKNFRNGLRGSLAQSSICDGKTFTRNLEEAYLQMWKVTADKYR